MKIIEQILGQIVVFILNTVKNIFIYIKSWFRKGHNALRTILVLALAIICLMIIHKIYPVTDFMVAVWFIIASMIISYVWSVKPVVGRILGTLLFLATILLLATVYTPGWKSTAISMWKNFDNKSFDEYKAAEEIETMIQDDYKAEVEAIKQKADSLLKAGKRKEAVQLRAKYLTEGQELKNSLDSADKVVSQLDKTSAGNDNKLVVSPVSYQPPKQEDKPYVKVLGKNKVRVHFTAGCAPIATGLYKNPGNKIKYSNLTAPFRVKGNSSQPYYVVSGSESFDVTAREELKIYSYGQSGDVDVELIAR